MASTFSSLRTGGDAATLRRRASEQRHGRVTPCPCPRRAGPGGADGRSWRTRRCASTLGEEDTSAASRRAGSDGAYYPSQVLWPGIERTDAYLRQLDFRAKKSLGQNFVVSPKVLDRIVMSSGIVPGDHVLEIGAGTGNLTRALLSAGAQITAVEKDDRLFAQLTQELSGESIDLIHDDVMLWLGRGGHREAIESGRGPFTKVVANLPFNITTDVLKFLLPLGEQFPDIHLLLQDEAAQRLVSTCAGDTNYRAMNVLICMYAEPEYLFKIDRKAFFPKPNVDGAMARFKVHPAEGVLPAGVTAAQFKSFVSQCFSRRRKMVRNNMAPLYAPDDVAAALDAAGIPRDARPQEMTAQNFSDVLVHLLNHAPQAGEQGEGGGEGEEEGEGEERREGEGKGEGA